MSVKLYVEGGGNSDALHRRCREGFRSFLEKDVFKGRLLRVVACGGRQAAYDSFKRACESGQASLLLIDSEDLVSAGSPWEHLRNRPEDRFSKPSNATDEHCHLMVVCMESWFLADKEALARFFGQGFNANALPQNEQVEAVPRNDVYDGIRRSTSRCKTKAPYRKGDHSFKILAVISPEKVRASVLSHADGILFSGAEYREMQEMQGQTRFSNCRKASQSPFFACCHLLSDFPYEASIMTHYTRSPWANRFLDTLDRFTRR